MRGSNSQTTSAGKGTGDRCVYCGAEAPVVWVHGHGQCSNCGINIEECCRGEQCTAEKG